MSFSSIAKQGMNTHLNRVGTTFNSRTWGVSCTADWPCKRMSCSVCSWRRRQFFIREGWRFSQRHDLRYHLVVSWPIQSGEDPWQKLTRLQPPLGKTISGKAGKYIRSLGVGGRERTPHIHFLVSSLGYEIVSKMARKIGPPETLIYPSQAELAHDIEGLLGYFYDNNFLPAYRDPERPRRVRILSGSRGMSYGFPKYRRSRA